MIHPVNLSLYVYIYIYSYRYHPLRYDPGNRPLGGRGHCGATGGGEGQGHPGGRGLGGPEGARLSMDLTRRYHEDYSHIFSTATDWYTPLDWQFHQDLGWLMNIYIYIYWIVLPFIILGILSESNRRIRKYTSKDSLEWDRDFEHCSFAFLCSFAVFKMCMYTMTYYDMYTCIYVYTFVCTYLGVLQYVCTDVCTL